MTESNQSMPIVTAISDFLDLESAGGILMLAATMLALLLANSPLVGYYSDFLTTTVAVQVGALVVSKPLLLWVNDGLMAVFFFLIGLEVKREILEGELSSLAQIALPAIAALGGMLVPALVYVWMNWGDRIALDGWAIPVATDIAFALALLGAFGARVPTALKVFLLTLAIFDDLAAIIIIALFYTIDLSLTALLAGGAALGIAVIMNRAGVTHTPSYVLLGMVLWTAVLKSGVHATLAGVLLALCIPMRNEQGASPLRELEHDLHRPVAFAVLPLFAFVNAGLPLAELSIDDLLHPVTLGIVSGLLLGKPLGVLLFAGAAVGLKLARLPNNVTWLQLAAVACACGIGFTMSLFIAGLAFEHGSGEYFQGDRLGILVGSILSALAAGVLLYISLPESSPAEDTKS